MSSSNGEHVTMSDVAKAERRLGELATDAATLGEEEQRLSAAITEAHASGTGDASTLTRQRREVRERRADVLEAMTALRSRLSSDREALGTAEAEKRVLGIQRAYGSLRAQVEQDAAKLKEAARAYAEAAGRVNDRFAKLFLLRSEADALAHRFGLEAPTLPGVSPPAMHPDVGEAVATVRRVGFADSGFVRVHSESCEHRLRTRRTYREVSESEGFKIIEAAGGPKPWPELTEKQREIVADRERAAAEAQATAMRFGTEAQRAAIPRRAL